MGPLGLCRATQVGVFGHRAPTVAPTGQVGSCIPVPHPILCPQSCTPAPGPPSPVPEALPYPTPQVAVLAVPNLGVNPGFINLLGGLEHPLLFSRATYPPSRISRLQLSSRNQASIY